MDALIPALPGLVRYKEAIAVKAEAAKNGQTSPMWWAHAPARPLHDA